MGAQLEMEPMVGVREIAKLTGYSEDYVRAMADDGSIPSYRRGSAGMFKFRVSEVLEALRTKPKSSSAC